MNSSFKIPIAIAIAGIMVAIAVYVSIPKTSSGVGNVSLVRPVDSTDHILGNPAAKVMIVEYSDFDCDFCKDFHSTLHQIIANAGTNGNVAWVFREFPITELHRNALAHARAAECVAQVAGNDAFWKFSNALYDHQPADPSTYGTLAASVGITGSAFANCYASASETEDTRIEADIKNALDMDAHGTPFSLILVSGRPPVAMIGGYSYDAVKQLIDEALSN